MRDRPIAFIKELGLINLKSRDDFKAQKKFIKKEEFDDEYINEEMELTNILLPEPQAVELRELYSKVKKDYDLRRAAMFLKLIRYSYSSGGKSYACQPFNLRSLFGLIQAFGRRFENVIIEN